MAVTETLTGLVGRYLLYDGTTTSGSVKTITQNIGTLNASAYDADKVFNIVIAMSSILDKEVVTINSVKTYELESE